LAGHVVRMGQPHSSLAELRLNPLTAVNIHSDTSYRRAYFFLISENLIGALLRLLSDQMHLSLRKFYSNICILETRLFTMKHQFVLFRPFYNRFLFSSYNEAGLCVMELLQ
jgi:hypothetical protein